MNDDKRDTVRTTDIDDEIERYLNGERDDLAEPMQFNMRHVTANVIVTREDNWYRVHVSNVVDTETGEVLVDYDQSPNP